MVCRGRRRFRPSCNHPRRHPLQPHGRAVAGRPLHHGGLLVHGLHLICQSGRCYRALDDQYVFGHSPRRSSRLHRGRTLRRGRSVDLDELAAARGSRGDNDQGGPAMTVTIYHNPACGTSRNSLAMIRGSGEEPEVIEYLKTPPSRVRLVELIATLGISLLELLRQKRTPYAELGLADPKWSDDELIDFMLAHPILINRPIVATPKGVRLCRPSELVLDLLEEPIVQFVKEDGEVVKPR